MKLEEARDALLEVIQSHYSVLVQTVKNEDWELLQVIAADAAKYGLERAQGETLASGTLRHLEAQVSILSSLVQMREQRRIGETLLKIATIAGEVLGAVLKKAVL